MIYYYVRYSRLFSGKRIENIQGVVNQKDLAIMINDTESKYKYIVNEAHIATEFEKEYFGKGE